MPSRMLISVTFAVAVTLACHDGPTATERAPAAPHRSSLAVHSGLPFSEELAELAVEPVGVSERRLQTCREIVDHEERAWKGRRSYRSS